MHDGPGVRTTVFLKGCPLRCEWCHNPETQSSVNEISYYPQKCIGCGICAEVCLAHGFSESGHILDRSVCKSCGKCVSSCPASAIESTKKDMLIEDIFKVIEKDTAFYGKSGGVTLSGGEPLIHGKDLLPLLNLCKGNGIGIAIETSGYFDRQILDDIAPLVDIVLWDLKDTNDQRHAQNTGVSNKKIIDNLFYADSLGIKTVLRCIMVNGVNTCIEHLYAVADIWHKLKNCEYVELIPYHAYGGSKAVAIGRENNSRADWIPSKEFIDKAKNYLKEQKVDVKN